VGREPGRRRHPQRRPNHSGAPEAGGRRFDPNGLRGLLVTEPDHLDDRRTRRPRPNARSPGTRRRDVDVPSRSNRRGDDALHRPRTEAEEPNSRRVRRALSRIRTTAFRHGTRNDARNKDSCRTLIPRCPGGLRRSSGSDPGASRFGEATFSARRRHRGRRRPQMHMGLWQPTPVISGYCSRGCQTCSRDEQPSSPVMTQIVSSKPSAVNARRAGCHCGGSRDKFTPSLRAFPLYDSAYRNSDIPLTTFLGSIMLLTNCSSRATEGSFKPSLASSSLHQRRYSTDPDRNSVRDRECELARKKGSC